MKRPKAKTPTALAMLQPARATREKMQQHGGDFSPMLVFAPRHGQPQMAIIEGDGPLAEELSALMAQMRASLGPAEWVALTTDCYTKPAATVGDAVPGALAKQFAEGDPLVTEQMMVVVKVRGEPMEVATQVYRWLPSEGFEWSEPETMEDYTGAVPDVINYYM